MAASYLVFLASFKVPYMIGGDATSLLWLLPLLAAISLVYKALKLPVITAEAFIREVVVLFGTILLFMALIAVGLYAIGLVVLG